MKVRLSMPGISVSMELEEEEAMNVFKDLAGRLIGVEGSGGVRMQPAITCNISGPVSDEVGNEIQEALRDSIATVMESGCIRTSESQEGEPDPEDEKPELTEAGLPPLMATDIIIPERCFMPSSKSGERGLAKHNSKARSKTFPGIAKAMAGNGQGRCKDEQSTQPKRIGRYGEEQAKPDHSQHVRTAV